MGQKDLTQKNLESFPDVFADIINALLYEGRPILNPEKLQPAPTETVYPSKDGNLRNQFHDVSKYEMQGEIIKLQYTIENEITPDRRLILRKMLRILQRLLKQERILILQLRISDMK